MRFKGIEDQAVELKIMGYQYPEVKTGDWDGNWLYIYINVDSKDGKWQAIEPALTTWDINDLIAWFEALTMEFGPVYNRLAFTEPCIAFEQLTKPGAEISTIRIKFDLEFRPPAAEEDREYFVDIVADKFELIRICNELKYELEKYPERGKDL